MPQIVSSFVAALAAVPVSVMLTSGAARAQYTSDFDSLEVVPGAFSFAPDLWDPALPLSLGQDAYYGPNTTSVPHRAQLYTGGTVLPGFNDYGIPDNPNGGTQFIVGEGPAGGVYARAQRDISYPATAWGSQRWVWGTDLCVKFNGTLPAAQNAGSFSVQPFPGSQSFIMIAHWTDTTTAASWDADYIWFDAAGAQTSASIANPGFQGLAVDHWYRWETVGNLVTNEIEAVRIIDLSTGAVVSDTPVGAYMEGGAAGSAAPTGFRFFAGGGTPGNVIAWDNAAVTHAGGITELPGCGSNPPNSLTVSSTPSWPILGSTLSFDIDAPAGAIGAGSVGVAFLSLSQLPTLPCGTPLGAAVTGNLLIGLPIGASLVAPGLWTGAGTPVTASFALPNNAALVGVSLLSQGALVNLQTTDILLTTGAQIDLGN